MNEISMFIPELQETLTGRRLDIWRGHTADGMPLDMPPMKREHYRSLWLRRASSPKELVRKDCGCKKS
jgi:hypothetical protein